MRCAWKEFLSLLPVWIQDAVDRGRDTLQELRLRVGQPIQMLPPVPGKPENRPVTEGDLQLCINIASRYSPWAMATAAKGYLAAPGGHRIGLCGETVMHQGTVTGIKHVTSLCIRVARDIPGIGRNAPKTGSVLIIGPPGWGKTTLLRDIIRCRAELGRQIGVVDERGELFPDGFSTGGCTDILTGCPKQEGIHMLLRTMGPGCIAVDEITQPEDCRALGEAGGCGVELLATAHARSCEDLRRRKLYRELLEAELFDCVLVMNRDKSWKLERMRLCL